MTAIILSRIPIYNQYNLPAFIMINVPLVPNLISLTVSLSVSQNERLTVYLRSLKYYILKLDRENAIENIVANWPANDKNEKGLEVAGGFTSIEHSLPYVRARISNCSLLVYVSVWCNDLPLSKLQEKFCCRRFSDGLVRSRRWLAVEFMWLCYQIIASILNYRHLIDHATKATFLWSKAFMHGFRSSRYINRLRSTSINCPADDGLHPRSAIRRHCHALNLK